MFECTYSTDKIKKAKHWKDGFLSINGQSLILYDEDKKRLYTYKFKFLAAEIITPAYIIYCERLVKPISNEEEILTSEGNVRLPVFNKRMKTVEVGGGKIINYPSATSKTSSKNKGFVVKDGIILIDENVIPTPPGKRDQAKMVAKPVLGRSVADIINIIDKCDIKN